MRVLATYGSKRGGTEELAEMLGAALTAQGLEVDVRPAAEVESPEGYDAVIVGGALYAGRWHRAARRFVKRNAEALRLLPVWLFSSGPLDDSAAEHEPAPVPQVARAMARVGARGHRTFGGRLLPDAKGFIASKIAREHSGDWRDPKRVSAWAVEISEALRTAEVARWQPRLDVTEQAPQTPIG